MCSFACTEIYISCHMFKFGEGGNCKLGQLMNSSVYLPEEFRKGLKVYVKSTYIKRNATKGECDI